MSYAVRSSAALVIALVAACGAPQQPGGQKAPRSHPARTVIDVSAVVGAQSVRGLSLHGDAIDLVVDGRGIVRVDRDGALLAEHKVGEHGLLVQAYNDVASLEHGPFVLLADAEGYLYDPATESLSVHFCVEPGFGEEPVVIQRNDAVAVSGSTILAAPRFYAIDNSSPTERLVESALRTYRADDGEPLASVDLTAEGLELKGIAQAGDEIVGVQGGELVRFTLAGELIARDRLEGIEDASGVAFDLARDQLLVTDAHAGVVRVFDAASDE